jgi:hypothetical protein
MKNYTTSKDYEKLWKLVQEGKEIICYIPYSENNKQVAIARMNFNEPTIFLPYGDWIHRSDKKTFITYCSVFNLEFLPPDEWIKINSDKDLPPDGQSVECVFRGKEVSHASWDKYLNKWDNGDYYWAKEDITHWKPLPEAPKE